MVTICFFFKCKSFSWSLLYRFCSLLQSHSIFLSLTCKNLMYSTAFLNITTFGARIFSSKSGIPVR
uniref:Uncharacterized protein n=1 Tax=Amphimedon queenslandica TaxID=400682 RepID=A0A1X7T7M4_AMPQE